MLDSVLDALRPAGWHIETADRPLPLPSPLVERYPGVPSSSLFAFLSSLDRCANRDESAWFLTPREFGGRTDSAFRWNEWELLSLDSADDDPEVIRGVHEFWTRHFPFLLSVRDHYSYLAVELDDAVPGAVVFGSEPEFESTQPVAESFESFLSALVDAVSTEGDPRFHYLK